jgi:hypothetical protein
MPGRALYGHFLHILILNSAIPLPENLGTKLGGSNDDRVDLVSASPRKSADLVPQILCVSVASSRVGGLYPLNT